MHLQSNTFYKKKGTGTGSRSGTRYVTGYDKMYRNHLKYVWGALTATHLEWVVFLSSARQKVSARVRLLVNCYIENCEVG